MRPSNQQQAASGGGGGGGSASTTRAKQKQRLRQDDNNDETDNTVVGTTSIPPTRDCEKLYCSAKTLHCARQQHCIPCAYKIACFDVALDTDFCQRIPNQRPETCPRSNNPPPPQSSPPPALSSPVIAAVSDPSTTAPCRRGDPMAVAEPGTLGYRQNHKVLTIGDGDFSFSLAIALMLRQSNGGGKKSSSSNADGTAAHCNNNNSTRRTDTSCCGLTATSYESKETLEKVYGPEMKERIRLLESLGVRLLYQIDGTKLSRAIFTQRQRSKQPHEGEEEEEEEHFHRIIWNFPCSAIQKGQDGQNQEMEYNKSLIRDFVAGAVPLLDEDEGQIHINHKTKPPFNQWQIQDVALAAGTSAAGGDRNHNGSNGVYYWGRVVLDRSLFPPYIPRKALHSKSFPVHDACTYIFGRNSSSNNNSSSSTVFRGLDANVVNLEGTDNDEDNDMPSSAAALIAVTRPLILSLRQYLLQSIVLSREKNTKAKSKRNRKKRRTY